MEGKPKDVNRPVCKHCFKAVATKCSSTSNLAKHLKDRHPGIFTEFRQSQNEAERSRPASGPHQTQPTLTSVFDQLRKYDAKSPEAVKINRAVAEYICMDQVPIYTVEKPGFQQLIKQLNPRYALPSRNHFMYSEIPELYNTTKQTVLQQLQGNPYFSCTTDLWTSRTASSFMAVMLQLITESWDMQSWCLGCVGLHSEHTGDSLREALEEMVQETWKLDITNMTAITTDNASNNKKAFQQHFTWVPCFGHNLHLAINKGLDTDSVSGALSRLRKTVAAFKRSPKMTRQLKKKQKDLSLPEHRLIHDEPTRWDSTFEMVDRFIEQQQAVSGVLAEDRKKWYLMPKDSDITILETVKEVLSPLSSFTDALSGEKHTTLSSVLPLSWKIFSTLTIEDTSSNLECQLKQKIGDDLKHRYEDRNLQLVLNTATFLDPRFKDSFTTLKEEVKQHLVNNIQGLHTQRVPSLQISPPSATQPMKKSRTDLKGLLSNIQGERKKQYGDDAPTASTDEDPECRLRNELTLYETMREQSAEEDPLKWWKTHESTLPHLAHAAKKYLCIAASSCASERVFSTSGLICSPRRARLTEEHIDMLVFVA